MFVSEENLKQFALEANMSVEQIRNLAGNVRSRRIRKSRFLKEVFDPADGEPELPPPKPKKGKPKQYQFDIKQSHYLSPLFNWNVEIDRFFETMAYFNVKLSEQEEQKLDEDWKQFMLLKPNPKNYQYVILCLTLYDIIKKNGGLLEVLGQNKLGQIAAEVEADLCIPSRIYPTQLYLNIYKEFLLAFEMYQKGFLKNCNHPVNIAQAKYFSTDELHQIIKNNSERKHLDIDIFMVQNIADYLGLDYSILNSQYLLQHYGNCKIDTRIQRPDAFGFDVYAGKMYNDQQLMKIKDYVKYQELHGTPEVKKLPISRRLGLKRICFAVNIDILEKKDISKQIYTKMDKFKFAQYLNGWDLMSYCENMMAGCNDPQLYLKVKGAYTGGHQENACMASVNINLGPDQSQWFSLEVEHVSRLRQKVYEDFNIDIIQQQGLWFAPPEWMIANNFPIKKLIQKKGDLIYSGPGTLHWVRSLGKSYQVAWNVFPKTQKQWKEAIRRTKINLDISYHQIFMPLKSMGLRVLNHQYTMNNSFIAAVLESVREWMKEQGRLITAYNKKNPQYNARAVYRHLPDNDSICQFCRKEIFTIYYMDVEHQTICLECCTKWDPAERIFFKKHNVADINKLLKKVDAFMVRGYPEEEQDGEIPELCIKKYCGETNCTFGSNGMAQQFISLTSTENSRQNVEEDDVSYQFLEEELDEQELEEVIPFTAALAEEFKREMRMYDRNVGEDGDLLFDTVPHNTKYPKMDLSMMLLMMYEVVSKNRWSKDPQVLQMQYKTLGSKGYTYTRVEKQLRLIKREILLERRQERQKEKLKEQGEGDKIREMKQAGREIMIIEQESTQSKELKNLPTKNSSDSKDPIIKQTPSSTSQHMKLIQQQDIEDDLQEDLIMVKHMKSPPPVSKAKLSKLSKLLTRDREDLTTRIINHKLDASKLKDPFGRSGQGHQIGKFIIIEDDQSSLRSFRAMRGSK